MVTIVWCTWWSIRLVQPVQIWGSLELGVWLQALCCHCYPPMQTTLVCTFHGVLPNIKLSHTPISSEKTHYSTVIIQGSTRFIVRFCSGGPFRCEQVSSGDQLLSVDFTHVNTADCAQVTLRICCHGGYWGMVHWLCIWNSQAKIFLNHCLYLCYTNSH